MPKTKAQVWIYSREGVETLFLLLKTNVRRGGFWQPVTGSVEAGEEVQQGALRECREETGLEPLGEICEVGEPFEFTARGEQVREYPFLIEVLASRRQKVKLDPTEHIEFEWCPAQRAFELLKFESNARVLCAVLKFLDNKKEK